MDNVLYLFSTHGNESNALKSMWKRGYFENLPLIDSEVVAAMRELNNQYNVFILSKAINTSYCKQEKVNALKRDFPFLDGNQFIIINTNDSKLEHAKAVADMGESVLIDDYRGNLQEWKAAGGRIIKKRFSNKGGYEKILRNWSNVFEVLEVLR